MANDGKKKILRRYATQISLKILIVTSVFICALLLFIIIAHEAVLENEDVFDHTVHNFIVRHSFAGLIKFMEAASFFGSSFFLLPAYIVMVGFMIFRKRYRDAVDIAIIAISSFLIMALLKQFFHRDRPDLPIIKGITNYSFPSGHSLSSVIFCSILGYLISKARISKIQKILIFAGLSIMTIIIGISRIVLNVHYATDVIAGFCFGVIWVILSFWIVTYLFPLPSRMPS
jgi:membrane-associated phospholipid phosphatase